MTPGSAGLWMTLAAAALFSAGAVAAAGVFDVVGTAGVAQIRAVIAAMLVGLAAHRRGLVSPGGRLGLLLVLGAFLAAVTITFYVAIDRLGVGPGSTIQFTGPVLVMVWARVVDKHRYPLGAWLAAVAAIGGTALITRAWEGDLDPVGLLAAVGAAMTFAGYLITAAHLGRTLPALTVMAYGFAFSALIWVVVAPIEWSRFGASTWLGLIFIGVAGTTLPFLMEIAALRRAHPGLVGVVATAEPVISTFLAWLLLSQSLSPIQIVGGAITVLAIAAVHLVTSRA